MTVKPLIDYTSYRQWLRDLLNESKKRNRIFTFEHISKNIKMGTSTFHMVLSGKRNLSVAQMIRLIRFLQLNAEEATVFEILVQYEQADEEETKAYYHKKLGEARRTHISNVMRTADANLFSRWYLPALYVYCSDVGLEEAKRNFAYIAHRLQIPVDELHLLFNRLEESLDKNMLQPKQHVFLKPVSTHSSLKKYLLELLEQSALKAKSCFTDPNHIFRASVLSVPKNEAQAIANKIQAVLNECASQHCYENNDNSAVIQIQYAVFPVL